MKKLVPFNVYIDSFLVYWVSRSLLEFTMGHNLYVVLKNLDAFIIEGLGATQ